MMKKFVELVKKEIHAKREREPASSRVGSAFISIYLISRLKWRRGPTAFLEMSSLYIYI